jgi:type II secretory pathway component PulF
MERSTISALERTGRLEHGFAQLGRYFQAFATARREIIQRSGYPVVVLHIGLLLLNVPLIFTGGGVEQYLKNTGLLLLALYGVVAIVALTIPLLRDAAAASPTLDRLFRFIPLVGSMRRSFALARFVGVYDLQLDAGVNVIDALLAAGRASRSASIRAAVEAAIPHVRDGSQVGPLLAQSGAFPEDTMRAIQVAEDTGELDVVLEQLAAEHQADGLRKLGSFSEWVPRIVYLGVVMFVAWQVISGYRDYLNTVMSQLDSI